jgi:uncharacterized protein
VSLVRLYKLQQVDTALARAIAHRQGLDDGAAQRAAVEAATGRLTDVNEQIHTDQARLKALDLEIRSVEAKRAQVEADMYSGRVRNPKELSAMQDDVAALARVKSSLEDEVLALYERAEQLDADVSGASHDLETLRTDAERQATVYREAVSLGDREIASLEAQRAELASGVDEDILRRYDRLRPLKGGLAVVVIRPDGICDGCHVAVPERVISRLRRDPDSVQICDACGRILVLPLTH